MRTKSSINLWDTLSTNLFRLSHIDRFTTAEGAELDEQGALSAFTPGNFVLGTGRINGHLCVVGGEDFTVRLAQRGWPGPWRSAAT